MIVLAQKPDDNRFDDVLINKFLKDIYQIYQAELLNPFGELGKSGKLDAKVYEKIGHLGNTFNLK